MLHTAIKSKCEKMFLVSGDTDLAPVLTALKELYPAITLGVISPMGRSNNELRRLVNITASISEESLKDSRFPDDIEVKPGVFINCPENWKQTKSST